MASAQLAGAEVGAQLCGLSSIADTAHKSLLVMEYCLFPSYRRTRQKDSEAKVKMDLLLIIDHIKYKIKLNA